MVVTDDPGTGVAGVDVVAGASAANVAGVAVVAGDGVEVVAGVVAGADVAGCAAGVAVIGVAGVAVAVVADLAGLNTSGSLDLVGLKAASVVVVMILPHCRNPFA